MADIGLKLQFDDPADAAAYQRALEQAGLEQQGFRVVTFDPKLNFEADFLVLVLKVTGAGAGAVAGFLSLSQAILKAIRRPKVRIEIDGKHVELYAGASVDDIKQLCDIVHRSGR